MFHDYTFVLNIFCLLDLKTNYFARRMNIRKQKMMDEGQKKDVGEGDFFVGKEDFCWWGKKKRKDSKSSRFLFRILSNCSVLQSMCSRDTTEAILALHLWG